MNRFKYTSVDRIFSKLGRELRGTTLNETDIIEWIGEALGFMKIPELQQQAVAFIEVQNYEVNLPDCLQTVLQVARDGEWSENKDACVCPETVVEAAETETSCPVTTDCNGALIGDYEIAYYRPYFDLQWEYSGWTNSSLYRQRF